MTPALRATIRSVNTLTAASRSATGTTRLTSPQSSAVAASIVSPVSSISITRFRATLRTTPTAGVEQKTPTLMPGSAKRAVSAATARSHIDTSWQPAADEVALPRLVRMTAQFAEVVSRAEALALRRHHHDANVLARCDRVERVLE